MFLFYSFVMVPLGNLQSKIAMPPFAAKKSLKEKVEDLRRNSIVTLSVQGEKPFRLFAIDRIFLLVSRTHRNHSVRLLF